MNQYSIVHGEGIPTPDELKPYEDPSEQDLIQQMMLASLLTGGFGGSSGGGPGSKLANAVGGIATSYLRGGGDPKKALGGLGLQLFGD